MLTLALLIVFGGVFLLEFVIASEAPAATPEALTADTHSGQVTSLLANAAAGRGQALVAQQYECHICHITGAGKIAPDFTGLAARAATAHPPLDARAYIYESITQPQAHIVED